ncbi:MAG: DUF5107 domain-containing protein [Planctomycetota bacterium]|jgi:tetratricopeptide (TPR) repeat protein
MNRVTRITALFFLVLFVIATAGGAAETATARIEKVTIPTFEMGAPDPAPAVFELEQWYRAYPRSVFRVYTRADKPVYKKYDMAVVENSLLRVEVLPAVGGRIWRIIDKTTGRNLLWTNDTVKPIRVGRRRGWIAGGVEFPFPVSNHGEDTMEPYRYRLDENEDGSASVTVSSFDHHYRFRGSYTVGLTPGEARMALTIRLYNPTEVRNPYQIWINAAVKTGDDMQFIFPVEYVAGHGSGGVHEWPTMDEEADLSFYRNSPDQLGVFGWDADFLGAYYHDEDWGIVRYCSKDFARGIKLWTWGTDSYWTHEYSLKQGSYNEIQGGRWPTQTMNGYLDPHQMDTWTEFWYPVNGLGGVDCATKDAALTVAFPDDGEDDKSSVVRLNVFRPVSGKLEIKVGGKVVVSREVEAKPGEVLAETVDLEEAEGEGPVSVTLNDAFNFQLISYEALRERERGPKPTVPASVEVEGEGPLWDRLAEALSVEVNQGDWVAAAARYRSIVDEEPGFAPAWKALGILLYRQLDYEGAEEALKKAAENGADAEALYYLAVVQLARGDEGASETLAGVSGDIPFTHAAKYLSARETLRAGDHDEAIEALLEAGKGWSSDCVLWNTLAVAARLAGKEDLAAEGARAALAADPLDPFAFVEKLFAEGAASEERVTAALGVDSDLYIETALFYDGLNRTKEALTVAQAGRPLAESGLYFYYLSYLAGRTGWTDLAREYAAKALEMGNDYVFPHRPEATAAFDYVAALSGEEALPLYHRGIMLYWLGRQDEAVSLWEGLVGRYEVPGLYKSVATAYSRGKMARALKTSVDLFLKAAEEDPDDASIYYALDDLYEAAHRWGRRRRSIEKAWKLFPDDDQIALRYVLVLAGRGKYKEAAEVLETHEFKRAHQSGHMWYLAYRAITETYCSLAMEALLDDGDDEMALEYLGKAASAEDMIEKWFD